MCEGKRRYERKTGRERKEKESVIFCSTALNIL